MNIKSKSRHINSNFHKCKQRLALTVNNYGIDNPELAQIDNEFKDVIKGCKDKYFQIFE